MRALLTLVVAMGVLIVAGVAVLGVTIVRRLSGPTTATQALLTLEEPPGTRMMAVTGTGDRLAVLLSGGGPDRILLLDPRTAQPTGRIALPAR